MILALKLRQRGEWADFKCACMWWKLFSLGRAFPYVQSMDQSMLVSGYRWPFVLDFIRFQGQIDFLSCRWVKLHLNHLRQGRVWVILFFQTFSELNRSYPSAKRIDLFMPNWLQENHLKVYILFSVKTKYLHICRWNFPYSWENYKHYGELSWCFNPSKLYSQIWQIVSTYP